ncbi:MAG: HIT domain-containing protein [Nanoarchaeota archaeon]
MEEECIFCKMAKWEIPSEKIYENDNFFSVFDISPQVEGHTLVISKNHFETMLDMQNSIGAEFLDCVKNTALKLMKRFKADGFNVVNNTFECAGQIVGHVHFHILPRKKGDGYFLSLRKKIEN